MSRVKFVVGDKVILVRGVTATSGKIFTVEMLLDSCPLFKYPQEIVEIDDSPNLLTLYNPKDIPCLYFMLDGRKIGAASSCFDLYKSPDQNQPKPCSCSIRDLMICGCKCGGK